MIKKDITKDEIIQDTNESEIISEIVKPASLKTTTRTPAKKVLSVENKYIEAIGRRKTSTARVRITKAEKESILINNKDVPSYFATKELQTIVSEAITKSKVVGKFLITAVINGGGIHSQAEAFRHGLSRAIVKFDEVNHKRLKKLGFLKRDPRMKERRKFGLKKARKAPKWSKR